MGKEENSHRVCKHGAGVAGPLSLMLCLRRRKDEGVGGRKRGAGGWNCGWVALWLGGLLLPECLST
jgi:hypothetical protein